MKSSKLSCVALLFLASQLHLAAADTNKPIVWHSDTQLLDANFENRSLSQVMRDLQAATGVEIDMPAGVERQVSAKFTGLKLGDAMGRFLTGLSYYGSIVNGAYHVRILDPNGGGSTPITKAAPTLRSYTPSFRPPGPASGPVIVGKKGAIDPANMGTADRKVMEELMRAAGRDKGGRDSSRGSSPQGNSSSSQFRKDRPR